MRSRVNEAESAAPPTSSGTPIPAARRSSAVAAIWCAERTSRPERPMRSVGRSRHAAISLSDGHCTPRSVTA